MRSPDALRLLVSAGVRSGRSDGPELIERDQVIVVEPVGVGFGACEL